MRNKSSLYWNSSFYIKFHLSLETNVFIYFLTSAGKEDYMYYVY